MLYESYGRVILGSGRFLDLKQLEVLLVCCVHCGSALGSLVENVTTVGNLPRTYHKLLKEIVSLQNRRKDSCGWNISIGNRSVGWAETRSWINCMQVFRAFSGFSCALEISSRFSCFWSVRGEAHALPEMVWLLDLMLMLDITGIIPI